MDILALVIGFAIGVIGVGIALEIGIRKTTQTTPASKHTDSWKISEITNPKIMAEYLSDVELPKDSKVIVNKVKNKEMLAGLDVKEHKGIKGNYIVGDDRALILSGPIKKGEIGFWTVEKDIVNKLNEDFTDNWTKASKMEWEET